jgi:hypothetical protein
LGVPPQPRSKYVIKLFARPMSLREAVAVKIGCGLKRMVPAVNAREERKC